MTEAESDVSDDIELDELLPWIEFGCWTAIALFPFLYWVNGPAVSTDQYVMRNILISVAVIGAFGLRYWNWRTKRRDGGNNSCGAKESIDVDADHTIEECGAGGMTADTILGDDSRLTNVNEGQPTLLCHAVFSALGLLLIAAAGFKTYHAYRQPMPSVELVGAVALVCFELCFGSWLLIGVRSPWTLRAAVVCFAAFGCVSAYKYLTGAASCGCFGALLVNPVITLIIDVVGVILLILCRTGVETFDESRLRLVFPRVALVALVLSMFATVASLYGQTRFVQTDGSTTVAGDLVVLEPDLWVGARWPLLDEFRVPAELASGTWDVLLFRHDCHVCHDVMLEIEQLLSAQSENHGVALIGIDKQRDDAQVTGLRELGCLLGRLPQDRKWFATTPLRIRLVDGICISASVIEHWE